MAEDAAVSVCASVVGKIGELSVPYVIRHISFLFRFKKHIEKLRDRVPELETARTRLEIKIKEATDNLDKIHTNVERWMEKASEVMQEAQQFLVDEAEANKKCCSGFCPNFRVRHKLARKAYKMTQSVTEMSDHEPGRSGEEISYTPERKYTNKNEGYQAFGTTRRDTFEKIKAALKPEDKTRMVLVHGMAGTGKTMLANEIAKQVKDDKLFSNVIFVAVSQKPDYKKIQKEIARQLRLSSLKNIENLEERADLLRERLATESNVLIILDDIWKELPLSSVGIYFRDDQKGCKILLTSRVTNVLQDDKHTTLKFEIEVLSEDESITLFNDIVGSKAKEGEFQELATEMVGECGKLPLAIAVVASALKNKELDEWKDALERLKRTIPSGIDGMSDSVLKSIELSYDFLDDVEAQSIFLLCCMQEEDKDVDIHYLLTFSFGLGIYQNVYTLEDARCRFRALISKLKHHSLLLEGYSHDYVKVHDVVRDFGIYTASNELKYNMRSNDEFNHCLREKKLENAIALSLLHEERGKLPEKLESPHVELLWMWNGTSEIPDSFFEETKKLMVLDLAFRNLRSLPSSFGCLENLRVLNLGSCSLGDISIIGNFKLLQVLEFSLSDIKYIPKEIGRLTNLRELDMFGCDSLTKIHPNVLSKLKELERLNLTGTPIQWEDGDERKNASLTELEELPNLKALYLGVLTAQIVSTNLLKKMSGFSDYEIMIDEFQFSTGYSWNTVYGSKKLQLNLESRRLIEELGLGMLLSSSEEVRLGGIQEVDYIIPQINEQGFPETKHMALYDTQIRYIVSPSSNHPSTAFERLESLRLHNLEKLELICHRQLSSGSFCRLQQLEIGNCNELKSLFSFSVAKLLVQLQEIDVRNCNMIEEIITCDGQSSNDAGTIEFPQLQTVRLQSLPKLKTFFNHEMEPSQGTPVPLFSRQVLASKLTNLKVSYCDSLKYLFSSTFVSRLPKLYYLCMKECSVMEEIITMDQNVEEIQFPQLQYLHLQSLPKFRNMCSGISTNFPLMTELKMQDCKFRKGQKIIFASDVA